MDIVFLDIVIKLLETVSSTETILMKSKKNLFSNELLNIYCFVPTFDLIVQCSILF